MGPGEVAVALLEAEEEALPPALRLQQADLLTDVLKARQGPAQLHAVGRRHRGGHVRGHDGGHGHRGLGHGAPLCPDAAQVVEEEDAHLVAGDEPVAPLAVGHRCAHAVAVRVRAQEQVRLHLTAQGQTPLHGLPDLRVGVGAGGEAAIRGLLLRHHGQLCHAHLLQQLFHALQAGAVEGGVHQPQPAHVAAGPQGQHRVHEGVQAVLADGADQALGGGRVVIRQLHAVKAVGFLHGGQDPLRRLGGNLTAVRAVDLVAVVLGGVVTGGDAHAGPAAQIPYRPAQGRGGLQTGVEVGGDAVGRQHPGRLPGKEGPLQPAVVGDGHAPGQAGGVEVVGQALGGPADGVDVHAVGPRPQHAPQAAGAEGQMAVESVGDRRPVRLHGPQLLDQLRVLPRAVQPPRQL